MKEQIRNLFITRTEPLRAIYENSSNTFYSNMPENVKGNVRKNFGIPMDEDLLFFRDTSFWMSEDQGLVMTTASIYWNSDNSVQNNTYYIDWNRILSAEYKDMRIYLFFYDGSSQELDIRWFFKGGNFQVEQAHYFASVLTEIANLCQPTETPEEAKVRIEELMNAGNYTEAEEVCDTFQSTHGYDPWVGMQQATITIQKGDNEKGEQEAWRVYNTVNEQSGDNPLPPIAGDALAAISYVRQQEGNYNDARQFAFYAAEVSEPSKQDFRRTRFQELNRLYSEHFLDLDMNQRQLLVPVKKITNLEAERIAIIQIQLTGAVHFPIGHPVVDKLYIAHPYSANRYILFDDHELEFLEDRLHEFNWLMQCLGATEVSSEVEKEQTRATEKNVMSEDAGKAKNLGMSVKGSYKTEKNKSDFRQLEKRFTINQKFVPTQAPYVPDGLVWFDHEPSWIRLATQRLQGQLLEHIETMDSKHTASGSSSDLKDIAAEYKSVIKIEGKHSQAIDEIFEEKEKLSIKIHVKFAPIDTQSSANAVTEVKPISQQNNNDMTDAEQEYLMEYKECLASNGGEFSDSERRLLERIRKSLGISVKRAAELEDELTVGTQLTEAEREYFEEYKQCAAEGGITQSERRLLNRMRKTLGISDERAAEIESSIKN